MVTKSESLDGRNRIKTNMGGPGRRNSSADQARLLRRSNGGGPGSREVSPSPPTPTTMKKTIGRNHRPIFARPHPHGKAVAQRGPAARTAGPPTAAGAGCLRRGARAKPGAERGGRATPRGARLMGRLRPFRGGGCRPGTTTLNAEDSAFRKRKEPDGLIRSDSFAPEGGFNNGVGKGI